MLATTDEFLDKMLGKRIIGVVRDVAGAIKGFVLRDDKDDLWRTARWE